MRILFLNKMSSFLSVLKDSSSYNELFQQTNLIIDNYQFFFEYEKVYVNNCFESDKIKNKTSSLFLRPRYASTIYSDNLKKEEQVLVKVILFKVGIKPYFSKQ